jgi:hypothetical protein
MIASIITDLTGLQADVTTVAGLAFAAALVIYFFVAIKPGLDAKIRINRQAQRRFETHQAQQKFKAMKAALDSKPVINKPSKPFFNHSAIKQKVQKVQKGFSAFAGRKISINKQVVKHGRMKSVAQFNRSSKSGRTSFSDPSFMNKKETMADFEKRFAASGQLSMKMPKHLQDELNRSYKPDTRSPQQKLRDKGVNWRG